MTPGSTPFENASRDEAMERAWESCAVLALESLEAAAYDDCLKACRSAEAFLARLAPKDPRRATTLNNLGIAALLAAMPQDAGRRFREAGQAWRAAKAWVLAMALDGNARSSLHHLRLETRHRERYDPILRQRCLRDLTAGRAASLFNRLAFACSAGRLHSGCSQEAMERVIRQRLAALGPRNPEAARMRRLQARLAEVRGDAETAIELQAEAAAMAATTARPSLALWREVGQARDGDNRALKAAVLLCLIVPENLLPAIRPRPETLRADPTSGRDHASP